MNNIPTNSVVFKAIENLAPKSKAYSWDNVGLQVGSKHQKANKIMITLDVLESVVDEAIDKKVNLIIAHHPLLFQPIKQINTDTPEGRILKKLIQHDITVYAAHTNLDVVSSGVNDMLADKLELKQTKPLVKLGEEKLYKYAVFVPEDHEEKIKDVLGLAGAGNLGDYTHCSFTVDGEASFTPQADADPFIGDVGQATRVKEVKIEVIVTEQKLQQVVNAAIEAHPYEEPAYDIIELSNSGKSWGLGRIGEISTSTTLKDYIPQLKQRLNIDNVRVIGDLTREVKKIAIIGGSGEKYFQDALNSGADLYITGDVSFHPAQNAKASGLAVIDAGHYIEEIMKESLQRILKEELASFDAEIIISDEVTDPFQYL
ncbi:Nif3-like dinuclear metal center hexameric protein [Oceanobacillus sp. CAU 1775]